MVDVKRLTGPPGCGLGLFADEKRLTGPPGCGLGLFADQYGRGAAVPEGSGVSLPVDGSMQPKCTYWTTAGVAKPGHYIYKVYYYLGF